LTQSATNSNVVTGKLLLNQFQQSFDASVTLTGANNSIQLSVAALQLSASGQLSADKNIMLNGTFSGAHGQSGVWLAGRGQSNITKIKGSYKFSATIANQHLTGQLELNQVTNIRPGQAGVAVQVRGTLYGDDRRSQHEVTGIANGGKVWLRLSLESQVYLWQASVDAQTRALSGVFSPLSSSSHPIPRLAVGVPTHTSTGQAQATLIPSLPSLSGHKWDFSAQLDSDTTNKLLDGKLTWEQGHTGVLAGTFRATPSAAATNISGQLATNGQLTFTMGTLKFTGNFDYILENRVLGTFVDSSNGTTGHWGISY
jgi:hypothetical protein